jgi:peptide/nickel transport system substrate-binding protein
MTAYNRFPQLLGAIAMLALAGALLAPASRSASRTARGPVAAASVPGSATMLMGSAPQSLDPGVDYTTEGAEVNWLVYTGLVTYRHAAGAAGTQLLPGLATTLPVISDAGRTYTVRLRPGLVFSNGQPVLASDFTYTVERALKLPWGGAGEFIAPVIVGAQAYASGKARAISGITTDDATGQIVIHLTAPFGPFDNVLSFPAMGLIPAGTPFRAEPTDPPPGVGPYEVTDIVPDQSFSVVRNPRWPASQIPDIPRGHVDVHVEIDANQAANTLSVLGNSADIFDWSDTIPASLLARVRAQAGNRFRMVTLGNATYFMFLNTAEKPFSSQLAREAVVAGINRDAIERIGSATIHPACFLLPPGVPGHLSGAPCPYGAPGRGDLARARALVRRSGMAGQPVTVWSETKQPVLDWMTYYAHFLNSIGFKATLKAIDSTIYWGTIGEEKAVHPQTGFGAWVEDFPNPADFYGVLLDGHSITPSNNENNSEVDDPRINAAVARLSRVPTTELPTVSRQWQALDRYAARKAYLAVLGYTRYPELASERIDYRAAIFDPIYGWDLSSLEFRRGA